ncbi:hypothetical protein BKA70DRAFT_1406121 [Coprinopsis sp. MPI-PUGE-AT-0042]|nr:hypothetical protein BKA70DRAFT_1406121 [Coprinopsis sp. MPI-PUGE-AT-0042]
MYGEGASFTFYVRSNRTFGDNWLERIAHLQPLVSAGIPCALWGQDVTDFLFSNASVWGVQEIIVLDDTLSATSQILQKQAGYLVVPPDHEYIQRLARYNRGYPYPDSIAFELHPDIANETDGTAPKTVTVYPQSYFGDRFNLRKERINPRRFIRLPSYLDKRILTPTLHTFLEGLVHILFYPPATGAPPPDPWREEIVGLIGDVELCMGEQVAEREIMKILSTNEAKWYMGFWFENGVRPSIDQIEEYKGHGRFLSSRPLKGRSPMSHFGATILARRQYSTATSLSSGCKTSVAPPLGKAKKKVAGVCLSGILRRKVMP